MNTFLVGILGTALAVSGLAGSTDSSSLTEHQALDACHQAVDAQLIHPASADYGVYGAVQRGDRWDIGADFTATTQAGDVADARFGCTVDADGKAIVDVENGGEPSA